MSKIFIPSENDKTSTEDIPILVPSWDGYKDLWTPFFNCFFKYWSDCPFQIFLGTNKAVYQDQTVNNITARQNLDYSSSLIEFLNQVNQSWIIVWGDDFFLKAPVATEMVNHVIKWALKRDAGHVRLVAWPYSLASLAASFFPDAEMPLIGAIPKDAKYRAGLTVGLWKKETLLNLLRGGESAWDFERAGSTRSNEISEQFFSVICCQKASSLISVVNAVRKGRWTVDGVRFLEQEGLSEAIGNRITESRLYNDYIIRFKSPLKHAIFKAKYYLIYRKKVAAP